MSTFAVLALLGLGQGAMYAAMAVGVLVTYRGTGVVNLAYATMAAYPAMAYHQLITKGILAFPWVVFPADLKLGAKVHPVPAFALALTMGVLLGVLAHLLVFRPLREATPLTRLVASIGLTVVVQGISLFRFGPLVRRPKPILPDRTLRILGKGVPLDRPLLCLAVIVLAGLVALLLLRTRFGLATRGAAESEKGAVLLGYSPDRLALANTALASLVGGVASILLSPIAAAGPFSYSFFVVPALAAALAGRLKYLGTTVAVAIALGSFQAMVVRVKDFSWIPDQLKSGFDEGVPFLLIVVVLSVIGKRLPQRGALIEARQILVPPVKRLGLALSIGVPITLALLLLGDRTIRFPLVLSMVAAVLMLSQVVLTGYLGQISLAQLTFQGTAGFLVAKFSTEWGWGAPWAPLAAVLLCTAAGVLVSMPATRIRGVQLAIVTLAFAIAAEQLVFRNRWFAGPSSVATVASPKLFGIDFGILAGNDFPRRIFGPVVLAFTVAAIVAVANLRRSGTGRRMLAVRANERAAAAAGIDVPRLKLLGSATASALAGLSGVMLAYASIVISPAGYESRFALSLLALGFLGGIGRLGGALVAGSIVPGGIAWALVERFTGFSSVDIQFFLAGFGLLLATRFLPDGIASLAAPTSPLRRRWIERQATRRALASPA